MAIKINLEDTFSNIVPGGKLKGKVEWTELRSSNIEVNLIWSTSGKGDSDVEIVSSQKFEGVQSSGSRDFDFDLPDRPYSFSGKLISLSWSVEAVSDSSEEAASVGFVLSPDCKEIRLAAAQNAAIIGTIPVHTGLETK